MVRDNEILEVILTEDATHVVLIRVFARLVIGNLSRAILVRIRDETVAVHYCLVTCQGMGFVEGLFALLALPCRYG